MPTLTDETRNAACDAALDLINQGSANPNGTLVIGTAEMAVELVTLQLSAIAFTPAIAGTATANTIAPGLTATAGEAAIAEIRDRDGNTVLTLSVGVTGSGMDIELANTTLVPGITFTIDSLSVTLPEE